MHALAPLDQSILERTIPYPAQRILACYQDAYDGAVMADLCRMSHEDRLRHVERAPYMPWSAA